MNAEASPLTCCGCRDNDTASIRVLLQEVEGEFAGINDANQIHIQSPAVWRQQVAILVKFFLKVRSHADDAWLLVF